LPRPVFSSRPTNLMPERSDYEKRGRTNGSYNGNGFGGSSYIRETPSVETFSERSPDRRNKYPQTQRKCDIARLERRKAAGLCTVCGKCEAASGKTRCSDCQGKHNVSANATRSRWIDQGLCRDCGSNPIVAGYKRCDECMATRRIKARGHNKDIRAQILEHYGAKCACCGKLQALFLDVDHIENDGAQHRRSISREGFSGPSFYCWLLRNHFPAGFQLLCRNCNWGKHRNGGTCPHKEVKDD